MKVCPRCGLKYPDEETACFLDAAALEPYADGRLGKTLAGRYVLESVLGSGGMAIVYRARHRMIDRPCAVKIMNPDFAGVEVVRERFRREAKAAQKLAHPNVVEIFEQGETETGDLFLVMELLEGETLAGRIERGPLPMVEALPIAVQIARALARAHDLEVVHRDLKPENVFLALDDGPSPRVVLLDFGISRSMQDTRLTGAGEIFGTPQYMAPERITTIDAGASVDLYALGVILFEMVTGSLPFLAGSPAEYFVLHLQRAPPRLREVDSTLPGALEELVAQLLAKDPEARPVDARRVHHDLSELGRMLDIHLPLEPSAIVEPSERAATLPPADLDAWAHRVAVFGRMAEVALAAGAPPSVGKGLERLRKHVRGFAELSSRSMQQQRSVEDVEARARDGRHRFGHAVDALGVDLSRARDEARTASAAVATARARAEAERERAMTAHAEVIHWEGRSGLCVPYAELAAAYRGMAGVLDKWLAFTREVEALEAQAKERRTVVADLEYQIEELRQALATFQQALEGEEAAFRREVLALGESADALERELRAVASLLIAELRGRTELEGLFRELEHGPVA